MPTTWDDAYRALQPNFGGVQNPAQAGNTGNIPYSPGMMSAYQGPQVPRARDLYQQTYPAQPDQYAAPPGGQGGYGGYGGGGGQLQMPPPQAASLYEALRRMLAARASVAATRGTGMTY